MRRTFNKAEGKRIKTQEKRRKGWEKVWEVLRERPINGKAHEGKRRNHFQKLRGW